MIETNIRILRFGANLRMKIRRASVTGQTHAPELMEKVCNALATRHSLAAVRDPSNPGEVLVLTNGTVPNLMLQDENWRLDVGDAGTRELSFQNVSERPLMARLAERNFLRAVANSGQFWRLDSFRIFYELQPFSTQDGVSVYRRFEISALAIDEVGVGIAVDVGTAFFTTNTIADFFNDRVSDDEQKRRRWQFKRLSQRQSGNKGTLIYESKRGQFSKCYFDSMSTGETVGTRPAHPHRVQGQNYASLKEYYQQKHGVTLEDNATVAKVSFPGIQYSVPVAANRLRLRVMNDALPRSLKSIDKIIPENRRGLIESFWTRAGERSASSGLPGLERGFWRPGSAHLFTAKAPDLLFGDGNVLAAPANGNLREHKSYYAERMSYLAKFGCFSYPPSTPRTLCVAVPKEFDECVAHALCNDIIDLYSELTRSNTEVECIRYDSQQQALQDLKSQASGMVLFVFDDDNPASYFNVAFELAEWRVKRIAKSTLSRLAKEFRFDGHSNNVSQYPSRWRGFIELNVLGLLQQVDCVPWTLNKPVKYMARLGIDVSEGHRYFAISLLIYKHGAPVPFRVETEVENKNDSKKETINEVILEDKIVELGERAASAGFVDLDSFLVIRDGRQCGNELQAIRAAEARLRESGFLSRTTVTDIIDFHKNSVKNLRVWEVLQNATIVHALEGTGVRLDCKSALMVNTGAATLRQGTAEPVILEALTEGNDISDIGCDLHQTCHLNWSNPRVAQRYPLEIKRTDEELRTRAAQEIRRIK